MSDDIKRIDIAEFRRLGLLQEANRRFFHPLGLALEVTIGKDDAEVEQKWKAAQMLKPFVTTGIKGTPKQLVEQLQKRVAMGITTFTIFFSDFAPPPTLELFAKEVMPAFV